MKPNLWYEKFAPLHEIGTFGDWFYKVPREAAIEQLSLDRGSIVFDFFCGTGIDFPLLKQRIGKRGVIYGVDGSADMLRQAKRRAKKTLPGDENIRFLRADFTREHDIGKLCAEIQRNRPTHLLFSLGLTCLPNWRSFSARVLDAAPSGTRTCIIDIHSPRLTLDARFLNWVGSADCRQPVWKELERRSESFELEEFKPVKAISLSVIVAHGKKSFSPSD